VVDRRVAARGEQQVSLDEVLREKDEVARQKAVLEAELARLKADPNRGVGTRDEDRQVSSVKRTLEELGFSGHQIETAMKQQNTNNVEELVTAMFAKQRDPRQDMCVAAHMPRPAPLLLYMPFPLFTL